MRFYSFFKITSILVVALVFNESAKSQAAPRRLLGTFIYRSVPYNYEFTKQASDNFTLNIVSASETPDEAEAPNTINVDSSGEAADSNIISKGGQSDVTDSSGSQVKSIGVVFHEFSQGVFIPIFVQQMRQKYNADSASAADAGLELFIKIQTRIDFIDDEPVTAFFILKKDSAYSLLNFNGSKFYNGQLAAPTTKHYIHRIEGETEDGALKNITVYAINPAMVNNRTATPRQFLIFKNRFPISLSGKFDYEKFSDINLYCDNCAGIKKLSRYIRLMDLCIFDIVYENDKEDYSPRNLVFTVSPERPITELRKEKRSRILEVAAFSDLVGLDKSESNGLIQIEAKRKININTKYQLLLKGKQEKFEKYDLGKVRFQRLFLTAKDSINFSKAINPKNSRISYEVYRRPSYAIKRLIDSLGKKYTYRRLDLYARNVKDNPYGQVAINNSRDTIPYSILWQIRYYRVPFDTVTIYARKFRSAYFNYFGCVEPKLLFSKLEQTNRFVDSAKAGNGVINPIDLYRHQIASLGMQVQIFRFNFPQIKLQWNVLNSGINWSRTRVALTSDSSGPTKALNSIMWNYGTSIIFRPDNRWGMSIGLDYILPRIWNDDYVLSSRQGLWQDQMDAWLRTGEEGKMFFRFRWTYQRKNRNQNFTQIQLGYALNLFAGGGNGSVKGTMAAP